MSRENDVFSVILNVKFNPNLRICIENLEANKPTLNLSIISLFFKINSVLTSL